MDRIDAILRFWFGPTDSPEAVLDHGSKLWFEVRAETDRLIHDQFHADLERAAAGALDPWAGTPAGRLALILLFDQFTRNIHRDAGAAYAHDGRAQALATGGIAVGADRTLPPERRIFVYMPLMHAEEIALQDQAVASFQALTADAPVGLVDRFAGFEDYAVRHREVIRRFGRFPHRNGLLGRESTPEELAYLAEGKWF